MKPTQLIQGDRVIVSSASGGMEFEATFLERIPGWRFSNRRADNRFLSLEHQFKFTMNDQEVTKRVRRK